MKLEISEGASAPPDPPDRSGFYGFAHFISYLDFLLRTIYRDRYIRQDRTAENRTGQDRTEDRGKRTDRTDRTEQAGT